MRKNLIPSILVVIVAGSLSGCIFGSDSRGTVEVRWTIGAGTQSCDQAGLDSVRVYFEKGDGSALGPFSAPCTAGRPGPFEIDGVDPGRYIVVIDGFSGDERVYTGQTGAEYEVKAGQVVSTETIILSPVPASMEVLWRFPDGRQCAFHGVTDMAVRLFLNNSVAVDDIAECAVGQYLVEDLLAGDYDVQVTGLSDTGAPLFRFTAVGVMVVAGAETTVDEVLESCADVAGGCN